MTNKITRKEYDIDGTETIIGLPYKVVNDYWNGVIDSDGVHYDDAFDVEEVDIDDNHSTGVMALAGSIASVRLQPRLIPDRFTTPKVNGFEMQEKTGEGVPDGYKVFALPKVGEEVTYTSKAASLGAVDDAFSWTDADGGHSFTRSELMVAVAECLGAAGVTGCVALGKMTEVVSLTTGGKMTDTEAMMDGRTSMVGYPVEGATDVVWATVPYAQLMSMAEKEFKDTKVLTALLVALGMPSGMARSECLLLIDGSLKEMSLNDGVLSSDTALQYGTDSLLACKAGSTQRPWIDCGIDGGSMLLWEGNQCVFSLLAAMAKKRMDSLCALALVGVGENGGVPSYFISAARLLDTSIYNIIHAEKLLDSDGEEIETTLANGTPLLIRQYANAISEKSFTTSSYWGGATYMDISDYSIITEGKYIACLLNAKSTDGGNIGYGVNSTSGDIWSLNSSFPSTTSYSQGVVCGAIAKTGNSTSKLRVWSGSSVQRTITFKKPQLFDLTTMFSLCPTLMPKNRTEFLNIFTKIGFIPNNNAVTKVFANKGILYKVIEYH